MALFTMPSLGADMEAGKLVQWVVKPGDRVQRGDIVAVVETQKGAIEIEVFEAGTVGRLLAQLGQTLPVGAPLAEIAGDADAAPEGKEEGLAKAPDVAPARPVRPEMPTVEPLAATGVAASPAARARAAELGIDLAQVKGSGPGGAIVLADVNARSAPPAPATPDRSAALAEMRKAIAAAMARSKREIPHYYLSHTVDLGAATDWLSAFNAGRPPEERLLMGALLTKAVALAARAMSGINGHLLSDRFHAADHVHLGLAVALRGGGLVAPAILDADQLSLPDLMASMRDLTTRVRSGRLRSSELNRATLTFSSLGEEGVEAMFGVIVPPQVALVTAGAPRPTALVRDGVVTARPAVTFALSADHRVSDARLGGRFLMAINDRLQTPEAL